MADARNVLEATSGFTITAKSVQYIAPPSDQERFEGVAYSPSGATLGVTAPDSNAVLLFRRNANGRFEETPSCRIGGLGSELDYPHDVSFSVCGQSEILAVVQRRGVISVYELKQADRRYSARLVFEIGGPGARLEHSDGIAFVPPDAKYLAACSLLLHNVTFYRRRAQSSVYFETTPEVELKHPSIHGPDGLDFSPCGRWLAIANHRNHTVSLFARQSARRSKGRPIYGPKPVTVIEDANLCHPHSVAFTPRTGHLVVTNAGALHLSVYAPRRFRFARGWHGSPVLEMPVVPADIFRRSNSVHVMEGGAKGISIYKNEMATCSPETGLKIYEFCEPLS